MTSEPERPPVASSPAPCPECERYAKALLRMRSKLKHAEIGLDLTRKRLRDARLELAVLKAEHLVGVQPPPDKPEPPEPESTST